MSQADCYLGIRGSDNVSELSDVPAEKLSMYDKYYITPVHHEIRVPRTRWCVLRYPNNSMAQLNNQSLEAFEDFYFDVCNLDYSKMGKAMELSLIHIYPKQPYSGHIPDRPLCIYSLSDSKYHSLGYTQKNHLNLPGIFSQGRSPRCPCIA